MVPIIIWIFVIILLFIFFSWWWKNKNNIDIENKVWLNVTLNWSNSEGEIIYPWGYKKKIDWEISLYKWEKIIIKEWNIDLSLPWLWNLKLNKLWELEYLENWDFYLLSSDLWINSTSDINLEMRFAKTNIRSNSHVSFSQNEMWSTIYLISWFVEVSNLVWKSTVLMPWQKITISRLNASKNDIDLSINKEDIDDFFKQSDWFIINNWPNYLTSNNNLEENTWTWNTNNNDNISSNWWLLTFSNLYDESNVSSNNINISWNFNNKEITKITLNWKDANINNETKTFKFENISVPNLENDLVFKIYDDSNDILDKFVYTVFYSSWQNPWTNSNTSWWFNVQTFDVDWSLFTFTEPTKGDTYTTYNDFVTIRWNVLAEWISKVTVNDYTLKSFNGNTWRYHASYTNNNIKVWTNLYEIKYFNEWWKLVYTNYFTIILKTQETGSTYSDEVSIN